MKTILVWDAFPSSLKKNCNRKRRCGLTHLCSKCSRVLREFFCCSSQKFNTICSTNWLQFSSSIGLHCVSLLAHCLPQSEAPPSAFIFFFFFYWVFHLIAHPAIIWLIPPFQQRGALLALKLIHRQSFEIWRIKCFHTAVQWCQERNKHPHKPKSYWLIAADPSPVEDSTFPLRNSQPTVSTGVHTKLKTISTSGFLNWHGLVIIIFVLLLS